MKTLLFATTMLCACFVQGDILFSDSFETYANGAAPSPTWVRYNAATALYVTNTYASEGTNSMYFKNGDDRFRFIYMDDAVAIDSASTALTFSFDFKAANANGDNDGLYAFQVDFGNGYETIITDFGVIDGADTTYTGTTILNPNTASGSGSNFVNYTITVPKSYYSTVTGYANEFKLKFITDGGGAGGQAGETAGQNSYVDNISVSAIPEPSSLVLMFGGLGTLFATLRFRKQRA